LEEPFFFEIAPSRKPTHFHSTRNQYICTWPTSNYNKNSNSIKDTRDANKAEIGLKMHLETAIFQLCA
jgi:hypothetical protein